LITSVSAFFQVISLFLELHLLLLRKIVLVKDEELGILKEWVAHNVTSKYALRYVTLLEGKSIDSTNDYLIRPSPTLHVREAGYVAAGITGRKTKSNRTFSRSQNGMEGGKKKGNEKNLEVEREGSIMSEEEMKEMVVQDEEEEPKDIEESEENTKKMMVLVNVEGEKVWMLKENDDDVLVWRPKLGKCCYVSMSRVEAIDSVVDNKENMSVPKLKKILRNFNKMEELRLQTKPRSKCPKATMRFEAASVGKRKRSHDVVQESDNEMAEMPSKHRFLFICFPVVFVLYTALQFKLFFFMQEEGKITFCCDREFASARHSRKTGGFYEIDEGLYVHTAFWFNTVCVCIHQILLYCIYILQAAQTRIADFVYNDVVGPYAQVWRDKFSVEIAEVENLEKKKRVNQKEDNRQKGKMSQDYERLQSEHASCGEAIAKLRADLSAVKAVSKEKDKVNNAERVKDGEYKAMSDQNALLEIKLVGEQREIKRVTADCAVAVELGKKANAHVLKLEKDRNESMRQVSTLTTSIANLQQELTNANSIAQAQLQINATRDNSLFFYSQGMKGASVTSADLDRDKRQSTAVADLEKKLTQQRDEFHEKMRKLGNDNDDCYETIRALKKERSQMEDEKDESIRALKKQVKGLMEKA
jgi:hypothetical protein